MNVPKRPGAMDRFPVMTKAQLLAFTHVDAETFRTAQAACNAFLKRVHETEPNTDGSITIRAGFVVRVRFKKAPAVTP